MILPAGIRPRRFLHVGCGNDPAPDWLEGWDEVRLDIDPDCNPDVLASMTDIGEVGEFGLVYSCHSLEHLYQHEVDRALKEFLRVLVPGGVLIVIVPDLEGIEPTEKELYRTPDGVPVCGADMYYGMRSLIEHMPHMAHHTGFVTETLRNALSCFSKAEVRRLSYFNLMGTAVK